MMTGSEAPTEEDELPSKVLARTATNSLPDADKVAHTDNLKVLAIEQEEQTDDFGLPVKRTQRPPHEPYDNAIALNDGEKQAKTQDHETVPGSRAEASTEDHVARNGRTSSKERVESADLSVHRQDDHRHLPSEPEVKPQEDSDPQPIPPAIVDNLLHGGTTGGASGWSHQALAPHKPREDHEQEEEWKDMPAFAPYDLYDDDNRLIAREEKNSDDEDNAYAGLGGAEKGYTRVQVDEDARSATSMDENTDYLFKPKGTDLADDEEQRDPLAQLQATKNLLTEGQRIAYVGVTRLAMAKMVKELDDMEGTKNTKKGLALAAESIKLWSQQMMVRLYMHMEVNSSEQIMIEQLAEHGVEPGDLTPTLMQNARVRNPLAGESSADRESEAPPALNGNKKASTSSLSTHSADAKVEDLSTDKDHLASPRLDGENGESVRSISPNLTDQKAENSSAGDGSMVYPRLNGDTIAATSPLSLSHSEERADTASLPAYQEHESKEMPEFRTPSQLGTSRDIDLDLRWTVLCDLFLVLIADSIYDARSRTLLERVGRLLDVSWLDICRFEKRVTDSLEMQEAANKETWDEAGHLENRRKLALKRRYMMMGLATVGGSLVIGLSAGLLAPVIGAGLAAGFTTIGVAGTSGFLAGAGGTALITSGAAISGGTIAVRASNRRTGAVKTFEYRPLHNNKRVNLIVTISGWMNGKIDDVRLPYSTVDSVMGDIYSVLWEPEMLRSMGDTINILATEVNNHSCPCSFER